ncbi:protein FMP32 mitochondrial-like [Tripterygium wilfordii]|uniref:Protein FMP32 mitochondrial-like n=1 Tax=Tripterygium wilfordii TaxID=458696 RepID=A0A7J7DH80_TRIWF|nr:mitochondrial calcium uniporter regulator 1-like [Tripterygium wilfordii]KAF5745416.1 protein FMP32 mitochondrial-like [Tripterygium wilfordii]
MVIYRRLIRLGSNCNVGLRIDASSSTSFSVTNAFRQYRQISELTKPDEKADTPSMVRALEAQGMPAKQAEAIVSAITEVLNEKLQNVGHSLVTKEEMEKFVKLRESNLSKFKSELESSQERHFSMLKSETEKLQDSIEKMRSELRFKIDNVTAGQRLDLNLERSRIKDELANQNTETTNLTKKLDQEILALRDQLAAAKYDVMKYYIGALVSIAAVGFAVVRIFM